MRQKHIPFHYQLLEMPLGLIWPWSCRYICYVVQWLNAQLTVLSTTSVWIETLDNPDWELPDGNWYVRRESEFYCTFPDSAPLKGCLDSRATRYSYYWILNGRTGRGNGIHPFEQNRKCCSSDHTLT